MSTCGTTPWLRECEAAERWRDLNYLIVAASSGLNRASGNSLDERPHPYGEKEQQRQTSYCVAGQGRSVIEVILSGELGDAHGECLNTVIRQDHQRPDVVVVDTQRRCDRDRSQNWFGQRQRN